MENNQIPDELLIKHLANGLVAEEQVVVESWISSSEQNREYFKKLEDVWNLAAATQTLDQVLEINMDERWERFKQDVTAQEAKIISIEQQEELNGENNGEETGSQKSVVYKLFRSVAIAASILLIVGFGWKFFLNNKGAQLTARKTQAATENSATRLRHEINTSGKTKSIVLIDGSVVTLSDSSELSFPEPFTGSRRDVTLVGKAYFKVAKDQTKPFTVISGDIYTTALGTEFTVTAFKNTSQVTVRLYEGKVVIKPLSNKDPILKKDVYLFPGQGFTYDSRSLVQKQTFKLNHTETAESVLNRELFRDDPSAPQNAEGSWFMFNNQSLEQVLDQLAVMHDVKIIYNKKDVQNIYFTGKFDKSDSVDAILKQIGTLNNLKVTKKDSTFIIGK